MHVIEIPDAAYAHRATVHVRQAPPCYGSTPRRVAPEPPSW